MDLDRPSGSLTTEVGACSVSICVYALYEHAVGWNSRRGRRDQRDKRVFFSLAAWTAVDGAKAAWTVPTLCIGSPDVLRSGGTGCEGAVRQRHGVQRAASFLRSCTPRRSPRAAPLLPPSRTVWRPPAAALCATGGSAMCGGAAAGSLRCWHCRTPSPCFTHKNTQHTQEHTNTQTQIAAVVAGISRAAYGPAAGIDKLELRRLAHRLSDWSKSGALGSVCVCAVVKSGQVKSSQVCVFVCACVL